MPSKSIFEIFLLDSMLLLCTFVWWPSYQDDYFNLKNENRHTYSTTINTYCGDINFVKVESIVKLILVDCANILPMSNILAACHEQWARTDSLGLYKQLEGETDGDWCLLPAYMVADYFQHGSLVYHHESLWDKSYLHFTEEEYRLKRINYWRRSHSWQGTEREINQKVFHHLYHTLFQIRNHDRWLQ